MPLLLSLTLKMHMGVSINRSPDIDPNILSYSGDPEKVEPDFFGNPQMKQGRAANSHKREVACCLESSVSRQKARDRREFLVQQMCRRIDGFTNRCSYSIYLWMTVASISFRRLDVGVADIRCFA